MKRISIIPLAALLVLAGSMAAFAQRDQPADAPKPEQQGDRSGRKPDVKPEVKQDARPADKQGRADTPAQPPKDRAQQQDRVQQQRQQDQHTQQQRVQQEQGQRQQQQDQNRQRAQAAPAPAPQTQAPRAAQQRQQQLVVQQQQRLTQYRQHLDQQQVVLQQRTAQLQQQKRTAQVRFQQDYLAHMRQQQVFVTSHHPDYDRDPFFFSVSTYRYNRGGHFYETNQYGADLLRQAVNFGYQEGFNAGGADRQDHWRASYEDSYAYQDANYGYNGYYVERDDYNFYFREGFRRGYDDGYNSRFQYGRSVNGAYVMLDIPLAQVLGFQSIR